MFSVTVPSVVFLLLLPLLRFLAILVYLTRLLFGMQPAPRGSKVELSMQVGSQLFIHGRALSIPQIPILPSQFLEPNDTRFVFNASGNIYVINRNESMVNLPWDTMTLATDVYYRATLDFDGVFTQYSHTRTSDPSGRWSIIRSIPDDICGAFNGRLGSGACGYNSYCIITSNKRPSCECPPGGLVGRRSYRSQNGRFNIAVNGNALSNQDKEG
ncbi:hypothetical protein C5167_024337 [Papaver somniferum]|uniref:S-locus glycoprotein domain-containing protein n=1 Tax=Papaver somniferum TaxID=3469 RepID=A0A4Y7JRY7_PAPSO|nr:hypothetical protein C5167_024337 [Papaver somniferum]